MGVFRIYYRSNGVVIKAAYSRELFEVDETTMVTHNVLDIDYVDPENKKLCKDVWKTWAKHDVDFLSKYYINNSKITERENWEEKTL